MKRAIAAPQGRVEYTLIQAARANVLFQALPGGQIRVFAPRYMPLRQVDAMVRERLDELLRMGREVDRHIEETGGSIR